MDYKDLEKSHEDFNKFIETINDPDELLNLSEKIYETATKVRAKSKLMQWSSLNFKGKFIRIYDIFGEEDGYMYVTSQNIQQRKCIEESELTLWGLYFAWNESEYTDDVYGTVDFHTAKTFRATYIKEAIDERNAGSTELKNYIEEITEEEFIEQYNKMLKFLGDDFKGWIDCMRVETEPEV